MKIEVDMNDIFCDEDGTPNETLQDSIQRQVVTHLTKKIEAGISKQIDTEVTKVISATLSKIAETMLPKLAKDMLNAEYRTVDTWGDIGEETTTFRKMLVEEIHKQMVYKTARYDSDKNAFTKAVDGVIAENIKVFQSEFNKLVTDKFRQEALSYAAAKLTATLGLK